MAAKKKAKKSGGKPAAKQVKLGDLGAGKAAKDAKGGLGNKEWNDDWLAPKFR